jgi:hypothetical protein
MEQEIRELVDTRNWSQQQMGRLIEYITEKMEEAILEESEASL